MEENGGGRKYITTDPGGPGFQSGSELNGMKVNILKLGVQERRG